MIAADPEALLAALLDRYPAGLPRSRVDPALQRGLERRGYTLHGDDEVALEDGSWLHPGRFEAARQGNLGRRLHTWGVVDSTNVLARATDDATAGPGTVWHADEQTAGRGRQGRRWVAPRFSSLLFSVQLPVDLLRAQAPQLLPLAVGVSLCQSLTEATGLPLQLKWPNDVEHQGRKLAGLLVETRAAPSARTILGVGINVRLTPEECRLPELQRAMAFPDGASSSGRASLPREVLLARVLRDLEAHLDDWQARGRAGILEAWRRHDALAGRVVRVQTSGRVVEGEATGIDAEGLLCVRGRQGIVHRFSAAEVHLL